jgi:hypothetical protein
MKKTLMLVLILLLSISLFGCVSGANETQQDKEVQNKEAARQENKADEKAVADLVRSFGSKLQTVSLLAPKDILEKSMQENYGDYVSEALLAKWKGDPQKAPGRLTSSPWPDRIEITSIAKVSEGAYEVKGEIIEITSKEKESGGVAAKRPITLSVKKISNSWLIDDVTLGDYE